MNDKLSLQDLADILTQESQISKKEAEFFFKEFFQLILDRIYENDFVKIKDFGTFKLTAINSRESVDVNTGEKIEIPAHYRFTFLADKALKELVNEPFSKYQTVLLEKGMDPSMVNFEQQTDIESDTVDDNEVSKVIQEQVKLVNELKAQLTNKNNEPVRTSVRSSKIELIEKSTEELLKKDEESYRFTQKPFVYTYSNPKTDQNKSDDEVILMTIPRRSRISKIGEESLISENSKETTVESDIATSKNIEKKQTHDKRKNLDADFSNGLEQSDVEDLSVDIDTTIYSIPDGVVNEHTTGVDKRKEYSDINDYKKSHLTETLSTFRENESENESESQQEVSILHRKSSISSKAEIILNNTKSHRSSNNPDRPLIPDEAEDINQEQNPVSTKITSEDVDQVEQIDIDTTFLDVEGGDYNLTNTNSPDSYSDKVKETFPDESDVSDVENDPFYNFEAKSTKRAKLRKIIPSVILSLIVLLLVFYALFKLFDVKYDYERYQGLGTYNLTMADTLPYVYEKEETLPLITKETSVIKDYEDSLSDKNTVVVDTQIPANRLNSVSVKNINGSLLIDGSGENGLDEISQDSIGIRKRNVSNNLSINVVNKAQYYLSKRTEFKKGEQNINNLIESQVNNIESGKPLKIQDKKYRNSMKLQQGMTLRSLSNKYYGNANYWVYIYMANKTKLPNPDALMIGMELVIPPLTQYGIMDANDPNEIEKARRIESTILG